MRIVLIAAVARNGVIGHGNQLLWHLPEDQKHFRAATLGCPVVMGRKTWDSLPARFRPLPGRHNFVVSRDPGWRAAGAHAARSLEAAIEAATGHAAGSDRLFVIGGGELYTQALPLAEELMLTEIDRDFDGDTHFPPWDRPAFTLRHREQHHAGPPNDFDYAYAHYIRKPVRTA